MKPELLPSHATPMLLKQNRQAKRHHVNYEDSTLAAIAGYVDAFGFVALFGLFTAHVTGNFVLIGAEVAGFGQGVLIKMMAFPAFIMGVALSSVLMKVLRPAGPRRSAQLLYGVQAVLLLGFCLTGVCISPVVSSDSAPVVICGMLGAAAMGVQNAHSRLVARDAVANTVMTGNVTQAVLDAVELVSPGVTRETKATARARLGLARRCRPCSALSWAQWQALLPTDKHRFGHSCSH